MTNVLQRADAFRTQLRGELSRQQPSKEELRSALAHYDATIGAKEDALLAEQQMTAVASDEPPTPIVDHPLPSFLETHEEQKTVHLSFWPLVISGLMIAVFVFRGVIGFSTDFLQWLQK
jgi:hypothetical protein